MVTIDSDGHCHGPAGGYFQQIEGQQDCQANEHYPHLVGKWMQSFRVSLQIGGIKGPEDCGDKDQNIPSVEIAAQKSCQLTAGDDQQDAAE